MRTALSESKVVNARYRQLKRYHTRPPKLDPLADYVIAVRDPIERAISAFNWRKKILLGDNRQLSRFPGELEALQRYGSLSDLSESLYSGTGESLDTSAAQAYASIHHLREGIRFYLDPLLDGLRSKQVFGVIAAESFQEDCVRTFGSVTLEHLHQNRQGNRFLTPLAKKNLRRFLSQEYESLLHLAKIAPTKVNQESFRGYQREYEVDA